jgi:LacI family transcriptional regulator
MLGAWQAASPRPTALYVDDDYVLLDLLEAMEAQGLSAPDDLALVGGGTHLSIRLLNRPLTLVECDASVMGERAVELALRQMAGQQARGEVFTMSPRLVVRESCGASKREPHTP